MLRNCLSCLKILHFTLHVVIVFMCVFCLNPNWLVCCHFQDAFSLEFDPIQVLGWNWVGVLFGVTVGETLHSRWVCSRRSPCFDILVLVGTASHLFRCAELNCISTTFNCLRVFDDGVVLDKVLKRHEASSNSEHQSVSILHYNYLAFAVGIHPLTFSDEQHSCFAEWVNALLEVIFRWVVDDASQHAVDVVGWDRVVHEVDLV